jgi:hypothetical protein
VAFLLGYEIADLTPLRPCRTLTTDDGRKIRVRDWNVKLPVDGVAMVEVSGFVDFTPEDVSGQELAAGKVTT